MHPLVRGAAAAAILSALGGLDRRPPELAGVAPAAEVRGVDGLPAPCLPGTLPEGPVCVRIPESEETPRLAAEPEEQRPAGRSAVEADRIARRPERPADPALYLYPIGGAERAPRILGSGGLSAAPIAGASLPGIHLAARPGEKVVLLGLDHQVGQAEVVHVGDVFGPTVVTRHELEEAGKKRSCLLFHGRLDRADPAIAAGQKLDAGAVLGFARADLGGGLIEVYLEARLIREGAALDPKKLTDASIALPIDPREVLPLRAR